MNVLEYGQLKSNPSAASPSFVELAKCASMDATPCKDSGSATLGGTVEVTGFTYNGTAVTLATPIVVTDTEAIKAAIVAEIEKTEILVLVNVTYAGGDLTVEHIGQKALTAVAHDTPGSITLTRACTVVSVCSMKGSFEGAIGPVVYDGSSSPLDNTPYNYTGTPATDATTAGTLATDIESELTALSAPYESVTVTVNTVTEQFDVVIRTYKNTEIFFGDSLLTENDCALTFE